MISYLFTFRHRTKIAFRQNLFDFENLRMGFRRYVEEKLFDKHRLAFDDGNFFDFGELVDKLLAKFLGIKYTVNRNTLEDDF